MPKRGVFITFEGPEGTGKSTQCNLLNAALREGGYDTIVTAEPGGTAIGAQIRTLLLDEHNSAMEPVTELLLYRAARRQHLAERILPSDLMGDFL